MFRKIADLAKIYPEQAFLVLFNTRIFAWLQATGATIANQIGLNQDLSLYVPGFIRSFVGDNQAALQGFFSHTAVRWLIASMILTLIFRFIKGLIKFVLFILIILVGLYLVYQNLDVLQNLM